MSPRAACRLETLRFDHVYDYVAGKADWLARGLPTEGEYAAARVGPLARDDVATCEIGAPVREARAAIERSPHGFGLVVAGDGTLLGRLRRSALGPALTVADAMDPGPSTVRPNTTVESLRERLDARRLRTAIVTTPEGRLLGVVTRDALGV